MEAYSDQSSLGAQNYFPLKTPKNEKKSKMADILQDETIK